MDIYYLFNIAQLFLPSLPPSFSPSLSPSLLLSLQLDSESEDDETKKKREERENFGQDDIKEIEGVLLIVDKVLCYSPTFSLLIFFSSTFPYSLPFLSSLALY